MAGNKTKATSVSVEQFIDAVESEAKREDAKVLDALFRKVTGEEPRMWGPTIIGYGGYAYETKAGRKESICRVGFSPRKAKHSLYISCDCDGPRGKEASDLLARLGKYSQSNGGCLYVNKLADIDLDVLEEMVAFGWQVSHERHPEDA